MKKITSVLMRTIVLIFITGFTGMSTLSAQTWTSIDGGGTNGISSTTADSKYPSVAVFNGELYAIWEENFSGVDQIHIKKYNGSTWSPVGNIAGQSLLNTNASNAWAPKIVTCNGALYAAWYEYGEGITRVRVKKYDGSAWTFAENYTPGDGRTNIASLPLAVAIKVDIIVFNNELYATWVEAEPSGSGVLQIRVAKFNGSVWSLIDGGTFYGINYDKTKHATNSTLCVFNNKLYAAWTESDASDILQLRIRRYDGGNTWTFVDGNGSTGLNYSTTTTLFDGPLSLSSYDGKMYAFWAESNRVRAKRYDEIIGWVADPADGGTGIGWCHTSTNVAYYPSSYSYDKLYVTWEQNPIPRQVRVASYDGNIRTFIDGNITAIGINNTTANRAHFPKLIEYNGNLAAVWSEELTSTQGSANQIRAKTYPLPPIVKSVDVPANGTYITGQTLNFTVTFSKDVVVSGGVPYIPITLNTGGTVNAIYTSGSGTSTLTFRYTIVSGNGDTDGVSVGTAISNGGATLQSKDATPLSANLRLNNVVSTAGILVDASGPTVTSVSSTTANDVYKAGALIAITITFSETATVTGTPTLALNSGGTAYYASGSGTTVLTFNYTIASGQNSADLDYSATSSLSLSGGTIKDAIGNNATLTLPSMGDVNSLGGQKNIVIDNSAPTLTLSSSATDLTNASPIPVTITFNESVTGFTVDDIAVTNGTKGVLQGGPAVYTIDVTPSGQGAVAVNVAAGMATDAAGNANTAAIQLSRTFDNVAPAVTITSTSTDPTKLSPIPVTITFSEAVTGFVLEDITVTNGTASGLSGSGTTYTVNITPSAQGLVSVMVAAGIAVDAAGNANTSATQLSRTFDNVAPAVNITSTSTDPTKVSPIPVTITFSEAVTGFILGDISVTNGTASGLSGSGTTYTASITPSAQGPVAIDIAAGVAIDAAGNSNTSATQLSRTIDNVTPSLTVSSTIPDPTHNNPISVNIVFSEEVVGFDITDVTVGNATASNLQTSDNINWTVDISANHMGAFSVEIFAGVAQDFAGNDNTASAYFQRTYDPAAPTVALSSTSANPTKDNPIVVNIALSESSWNVLDISKIVVGNGTASNLQLLETGYHENWTVDIYPSADGLVTVDIPAGVFQDYAGNNNIAAAQFSRTCDITSPKVTLSSTAREFTNTSSIPVTITFNEPVTGFVVGDITVTNGTAGNFSGSGTTYTVDITPSGQGVVAVNVAAGVAQDALGNNNIAATPLSRTYDNVAATVLSVSSSTIDGVYKTGDVITITTTFSEAVLVNGIPTLALNSGGTASYISGSGSATLSFGYTVADDNSCEDLDYLSTSSLSLSGGEIKDEAENPANLTLPEVGGSNSLSGQKDILIGIIPEVTTQSVSDLLSTTATGNGSITDLGYPNPVAYGVCWNTTGAPAISDSKADKGTISSTGSFTASMTGLASGTTFYVRAYVTNSAGTSYGDEVSFTTNGVITYNLNGGTNNEANAATYVYGTGLALSDPTRTNYTFGGWYDNETFTGSAITSIGNTTKGDVTLYAKWNSATGIDIAASSDITLFPNPARDKVFINGTKGVIYVYDINSHLVLTKQIDNSSSVDISSLTNGIYFVKVNNKNFKLIKE